jgi:hypothetical protein
MPWVYQVFAGRSQQQPTGLVVREFWEQQMVGELDIDLAQRSIRFTDSRLCVIAEATSLVPS